MARPAVETLLFLFDFGFDGNLEHSLMGNLVNVSEDDWEWRAAGSGRSIKDIALHAGTAKYVYANHAFGDASISWAQGSREIAGLVKSLADAGAWLTEVQKAFRDGIASLTDADLSRPRPVHYGPPQETRSIIASMLQHDLYHAGEINHLRAVRQGTDFWPGAGSARRGPPR